MDRNEEKPEKGIATSVAVDGGRIRSIREQKKLTQLYVANVVGVTTDTISRWENNRYPSMKRENAEKLADALEVNLDEILRRDEAPEPDGQVQPAHARPRRHLLWWGVILLGLAATLPFIVHSLIPAPLAVRSAPKFAAPGEVIPVQIKVTRPGGEPYGLILKERLPSGWELVTTTPSSATVEFPGSVIKWLIPRGSGPVTVSYTARLAFGIPPGTLAHLQGEVIFHSAGMSRSRSTGGDGTLKIGPYHWADRNGDGKIDDDEIMPAYYLCEEMKGFNLDWKTIEAIWSGKGYRWEPKEGYVVVK